ncbi:MAG: phospholipase D-like domain-containing protein [FCB group bacterium]|jgi:cardiolipin synthase|nr:phospholipase D-like domain-containing protein [FCB group bacterium]
MIVFWTVVITFLVTVIAGVIAFNLTHQEKRIEYLISAKYSVADPQFRRAMGQLLPPPILPGNRVQTLLNGDQIFPAMLDAIAGAQKTITFESYIFWSGEIAQKFTDALAERARAGVCVHVLVDWAGGFSMKNDYIDQMKEAGVEFQVYHPLRWYHLDKMNNRTHRKILVVDGKVAFTGGVGIADEWDGNATDPDHYRDCQFRLEGPSVAQMQSAFMDNWLKVANRVLHDEGYFPPLEPAGDLGGQVFMSSPQEGSESVRLMFMLSIACAAKRIWIANAYFVPDDLSRKTLIEAKQRGVDVKVIVPGPKIDARVTRRVSRARWGPMLEAGIEIYEYQPVLFHCKYAVFDDRWSSVGSTNFDNRSFRLNDEVILNVYSAEFADEQARMFQDDLANSRRITLEEWRNRPWRDKVKDNFFAIFHKQF